MMTLAGWFLLMVFGGENPIGMDDDWGFSHEKSSLALARSNMTPEEYMVGTQQCVPATNQHLDVIRLDSGRIHRIYGYPLADGTIISIIFPYEIGPIDASMRLDSQDAFQC